MPTFAKKPILHHWSYTHNVFHLLADLANYVPQNNNFVVYNQYFEQPKARSSNNLRTSDPNWVSWSPSSTYLLLHALDCICAIAHVSVNSLTTQAQHPACHI